MDAVSTNPEGIPKAELMKLAEVFGHKPGINLALFIASGALLNKTTWTGEDYSLHWLWVAGVNDEHLSIDEKIVGILHDVVEDSDWEIEDLEAMGFSSHITEAVRSLTKIENEKYLDAVKRCSYNPIGRKIKKRDNRHNMDLTRSRSAPTPKQKFLYPISYAFLNAVDNGEVAVGSSVWKFLQMDKYKELLSAENYNLVASSVSEPVPASLKAVYGEPVLIAKKPRADGMVSAPA